MCIENLSGSRSAQKEAVRGHDGKRLAEVVGPCPDSRDKGRAYGVLTIEARQCSDDGDHWSRESATIPRIIPFTLVFQATATICAVSSGLPVTREQSKKARRPTAKIIGLHGQHSDNVGTVKQ